ncbi:MAG TPA: hypothetical protein VHE08_08685 [Solirubrobacterales bacterium]|nr:hypothetical protein [Solirubrobacterales bacterium]
MIAPDTVAAGIRIVRAEEAWEPVLLGGMIPILGALAIFWLIWHAVRDNPENDPPGGEREEEGGPEDPPSDGPT